MEATKKARKEGRKGKSSGGKDEEKRVSGNDQKVCRRYAENWLKINTAAKREGKKAGESSIHKAMRIKIPVREGGKKNDEDPAGEKDSEKDGRDQTSEEVDKRKKITLEFDEAIKEDKTATYVASNITSASNNAKQYIYNLQDEVVVVIETQLSKKNV